MNPENIKAIVGPVSAVLIILGGMVMLYDLITRGSISGEAGLAIIGPLIGAAGLFLFNQQQQSSTVKQMTNAMAAGVAASAPRSNPDVVAMLKGENPKG